MSRAGRDALTLAIRRALGSGSGNFTGFRWSLSMTNLSDLQSALLTAAATREGGELLPPPPTIATTPAAAGRAIAALVRHGFAEKTGAIAIITDAGREAVGLPLASAKPATKQSQVIALLKRPDGASIDELMSLTGWLPHTTRAALAGLRKRNHDFAKDRVDGVTRYRIAC